MLRLVFMGSDAIALPALNWLAGEGCSVARVVGVFTQPDRAFGRGQQVQPNAIKLWAQAHDVPVWQPTKVDADARAQLAAVQPDVTLVLAYGHLLRQEFIDTPRLGTLNLHTSLLPKLRGASPIQTAIATGECETGVTLMRMVLRLDAGPVGDVQRVPIDPLDTATEVEAKLAQACVPLLARALPQLTTGALVFTPQDEAQVTYCRRHVKDDGVLDFAAPAAALAGRINGLAPWPGCVIALNGQPVKLGSADVPAQCHLIGDIANASHSATCHLIGDIATTPGTVLGADAEGLLVATGAGVLRLRKLQRPGGKLLPAVDFLRGFPGAPGTSLLSRPMTALVSSVPFPRVKN